MDRLDSLAMDILPGLMSRYLESGYSDESAIHEVYRLAEKIIIAKPQKTTHNKDYVTAQKVLDEFFESKTGWQGIGGFIAWLEERTTLTRN